MKINPSQIINDVLSGALVGKFVSPQGDIEAKYHKRKILRVVICDNSGWLWVRVAPLWNEDVGDFYFPTKGTIEVYGPEPAELDADSQPFKN